MFNPYHPEPAKIVGIKPQTDTIKLFRFELGQKIWGYNFNFNPGQIIELSIPGFGEAPFAPCNAPGSKYLELCIRAVGKLTNRLHEMKVGDKVGIRGPFGQGWPSFQRSGRRNNSDENLLIVVGGLGLIPLRTLILGKKLFLGKKAKIQIFYGAKASQEMLFRDEYDKWRENNVEINLTVDKKCPDWQGCVGLVTMLFEKTRIIENARVFVCGPPVMYRAVLEKLKTSGFSDDDIYLSLERRMHCGLGVCQHCGIGTYYTCKHGPAFNYAQIKNIPGAI